MTATTSTAICKLEKLESFAKGHRNTIAEMLLGDVAGETTTARDIAGEVTRLARTEGEIQVWRTVVRFLDLGRDESEIRDVITDLLLTGADDTWSGRGNDGRRAQFDGIREAARSVLAGWAW